MTLPAVHPLAEAMKACRRHLMAAAAFSLAINLLHLTAPLYMMQVYDRVMASSSGTTLIMLTLMMLVAFAALAGLDRMRTGLLIAASARLDRLLAGRTFAAMMAAATRDGSGQALGLRDLDSIRQLVAGNGIAALLDVPWIPIYVLIGFMLHWSIGMFTLLCALTLIVLAVASEWALRARALTASAAQTASQSWAEASLRNAAAVRAMAMMPGLSRRWSVERIAAAGSQRDVAERTADLGALVRFLRLSMQSLVLGLGAWLAIERSITPGAIFAASLLLGRALQPVEHLIGHWNALTSAHAALTRLQALLSAHGHAPDRRLPRPAHVVPVLAAQGVSFSAGGSRERVLDEIGFVISPGESVGLIGPSGAGKSSLVRLIVGADVPDTGRICLGGIDTWQLPAFAGRPLIGYMPQEIELFDDTVAANICRFETADVMEVVRAAQLAGAHDLIMGLPGGYHFRIGPSGMRLSGGMRQRIALARAVYGDPMLVVLDEPSASLDKAGDRVLEDCIRHLQARGTSLVVISHRPVTTALMHKFLALIHGRVRAFGPRDAVVRELSSRKSAPQRPGTAPDRMRAAGRVPT